MTTEHTPHTAPLWEDFAKVRSALGASGQQEVRGLAALQRIEEQLEAILADVPTILWIIEELYNGGSWHNMEKRREGINEALDRFTQLASSPASEPYGTAAQGYAVTTGDSMDMSPAISPRNPVFEGYSYDGRKFYPGKPDDAPAKRPT